MPYCSPPAPSGQADADRQSPDDVAWLVEQNRQLLSGLKADNKELKAELAKRSASDVRNAGRSAADKSAEVGGGARACAQGLCWGTHTHKLCIARTHTSMIARTHTRASSITCLAAAHVSTAPPA